MSRDNRTTKGTPRGAPKGGRPERISKGTPKSGPSSAKPPWSVPVTVHEVSESGRHFKLVPDDGTRAAVAASIGLSALPRFEASFDVSRQGRDGLHVTGRVSATIGQTCVVTLEPIENEVDEAVDLAFVPDAAPEFSEEPGGHSQVADDDAPEPLVGNVIDLGVIATEFLSLGIDPYPRKAGVEFDTPAVEDDTPHPFAALAALKKGQGES